MDPIVVVVPAVKATIHYNRRTQRYHVTKSRLVQEGSGLRREIVRESYPDYAGAVSSISFYWGFA